MAAATAGPASSQRLFQSFSDALLDGDPQAVLEKLTKALEQNPDDTQYYCQRAYCHILLGKYCDGTANVKKSLELNPNNFPAILRKGICEYHDKDYASASDTFAEGQKLDSTGTNLDIWIKRCQEIQNGSESEVSASQRTQSIIKYDRYQTESQAIITLMIKDVRKNDVHVGFSERESSALVTIPSGEDYSLKVRWLHPRIPEQSTFKVLPTKLGDPALFPAVTVEHVPGADILNSYAGLARVEEPSDMITESSLDVAKEEITDDDDDDDDITLTVEDSCHNGDETTETIEAAEALLNIDSPSPPVLDEK